MIKWLWLFKQLKSQISGNWPSYACFDRGSGPRFHLDGSVVLVRDVIPSIGLAPWKSDTQAEGGDADGEREWGGETSTAARSRGPRRY